MILTVWILINTFKAETWPHHFATKEDCEKYVQLYKSPLAGKQDVMCSETRILVGK